MRLTPIFISLCLYTPILFGQRSLPLEVKVTNLKEKQVQLSEIMDGNIPVIICFWASWCKPCINELEALNELSEKWKNKVRIVAISIDDSRSASKVKSIVAAKNWPFDIYIDQNQNLKRSLNIVEIPYAIVVSKTNKITYKHTGYTPGSEEELITKALELGNK